MAYTWILGGRGDMSDASNTNGGGFSRSYGTTTYTTCQGVDGGPTSDSSTWDGSLFACTVTDGHNSGQIAITKVGGFTDCVIGTYVNVKFVDATYTDDWYRVVDQDDDYIDIQISYISDKDCDCKVGGAFATNADGIDATLDLVAADDIVLACTSIITSTNYSIDATINPAATAGTALTPIVIKGANGDDGTDLSLTDARPIFKASTTLASGIININNAATDYYRWENIIFDGDNDAAYCVYSNVSADWHYWSNCLFKNSTTHGVSFLGNYWRFVDCIGRDSGVAGIVSDGENCLIINSESYDNTYNGFVLRGKNNGAVNCKAYNNQSRGFIIYENNGGFLINCTCYNSGEENYNFSGSGGSESTFVIVCNCTGDSAGIGFDDYEIDSVTSRIAYFGNNHANSTSYCSECINDNFTDYLNGNNITGDPKFVSVVSGSEDFDLLFDSPLQRTGINNTTIGAGTRKNPGGGNRVLGGGIVR